MLLFGYLGETFLLPAWPAFIGGVLGWFFILLDTFSATCSEPWTRPSSMCSTTLRISSTRLRSCLRAGLAPKQNPKARRMLCWLRFCSCHFCKVFSLSRVCTQIGRFYSEAAIFRLALTQLAEESLELRL